MLPLAFAVLEQNAEKVRQLRSRIVQTLNGGPAASPLGGAHRLGAPYSSHRAPQRVRLGPSLAAALLDGFFEHPASVYSCYATGANHRSPSGLIWFFSILLVIDRSLEYLLDACNLAL
jgi:hypothetical protein